MVDDRAELEEAFKDDVGLSIMMPTGRIQDLPVPCVTHTESLRSPYRKAFEHSHHLDINRLPDVGCSEPVDEGNIPKGRKIVGSKWVYTYKGDEVGLCMRTKPRLVAKCFTQVQDVNYHVTTPLTPASAPPKMLAVGANEPGFPVFHLGLSQTFVQAYWRKKYACVFPQDVVNVRVGL